MPFLFHTSLKNAQIPPFSPPWSLVTQNYGLARWYGRNTIIMTYSNSKLPPNHHYISVTWKMRFAPFRRNPVLKRKENGSIIPTRVELKRHNGGKPSCTKLTVISLTTSSKKPEADIPHDSKVMSPRSRTDTAELPVIGTILTSCFANAAILLFVATMLQKLVI